LKEEEFLSMSAIKVQLQDSAQNECQEGDTACSPSPEKTQGELMSAAKPTDTAATKANSNHAKGLRKRRVKSSATQKVDPLFSIFEQHLLNFQDPEIDRKTFIAKVVADYLSYLRKMNVTVPKTLEQPIVEELADQVNTILIKRIYGCFSIEEYRKSITPSLRRRARTRYSRLGFK